jgi:hypothetical protein
MTGNTSSPDPITQIGWQLLKVADRRRPSPKRLQISIRMEVLVLGNIYEKSERK